MWLNGYPRLHGYSMWWMFISHVPMEVALVIGSSLEIDSVARANDLAFQLITSGLSTYICTLECLLILICRLFFQALLNTCGNDISLCFDDVVAKFLA